MCVWGNVKANVDVDENLFAEFRDRPTQPPFEMTSQHSCYYDCEGEYGAPVYCTFLCDILNA